MGTYQAWLFKLEPKDEWSEITHDWNYRYGDPVPVGEQVFTEQLAMQHAERAAGHPLNWKRSRHYIGGFMHYSADDGGMVTLPEIQLKMMDGTPVVIEGLEHKLTLDRPALIYAVYPVLPAGAEDALGAVN